MHLPGNVALNKVVYGGGSVSDLAGVTWYPTLGPLQEYPVLAVAFAAGCLFLLRTAERPALGGQIPASGTGPGGTIRVSNPALDFKQSVIGGFTQSTSSSAMCGNSVVVGYADAGARLRTHGFPQPALGQPGKPSSGDGVSYSMDGGLTFTDLGFLPQGSGATNILVGDPSVACSSPSRFYYASILVTGTGQTARSSISVSTSANGGRSWGSPVVITPTIQVSDKPWMAVDPSNPANLYVSFTAVNPPQCPPQYGGFAVGVVSSTNSGATWSAPTLMDIQCGPQGNIVTGSNVAVSPQGFVDVAWELIPGNIAVNPPPNEEIRFASSQDHGKTFSTAFTVSQVVPTGEPYSGSAFFYVTGVMQGGFRANEFPQIAVDRSSGSSRGTIYIAWADGRDHVTSNPASQTGRYDYADIIVAKSGDSGRSFAVLPAISPVPANFTGPGRDQFFPGIAVDKNGTVAACYYDRRNDPNNMRIDRFCSVSTNKGFSWTDQRASNSNWLPLICSDYAAVNMGCSEMGLYDTVTTDFFLLNSGFFASFQIQEDGNANILAKKF